MLIYNVPLTLRKMYNELYWLESAIIQTEIRKMTIENLTFVAEVISFCSTFFFEFPVNKNVKLSTDSRQI